jgi:molybdopterin converting factor small subunit
MKVLVKFYVFDLPPGFADAELSLPDGSVVGDVLDECLELLKRRQVEMGANELRSATVMINNVWSGPDDPVSDGDTLTVIRPMDGG